MIDCNTFCEETGLEVDEENYKELTQVFKKVLNSKKFAEAASPVSKTSLAEYDPVKKIYLKKL